MLYFISLTFFLFSFFFVFWNFMSISLLACVKVYDLLALELQRVANYSMGSRNWTLATLEEQPVSIISEPSLQPLQFSFNLDLYKHVIIPYSLMTISRSKDWCILSLFEHIILQTHYSLILKCCQYLISFDFSAPKYFILFAIFL